MTVGHQAMRKKGTEVRSRVQTAVNTMEIAFWESASVRKLNVIP